MDTTLTLQNWKQVLRENFVSENERSLGANAYLDTGTKVKYIENFTEQLLGHMLQSLKMDETKLPYSVVQEQNAKIDRLLGELKGDTNGTP